MPSQSACDCKISRDYGPPNVFPGMTLFKTWQKQFACRAIDSCFVLPPPPVLRSLFIDIIRVRCVVLRQALFICFAFIHIHSDTTIIEAITVGTHITNICHFCCRPENICLNRFRCYDKTSWEKERRLHKRTFILLSLYIIVRESSLFVDGYCLL